MSERLKSTEYEQLKQEYMNGWKTWNVNSVLSHVHMPDALALNLGIKEYGAGGYLREALIGRFPSETLRTPVEVLYPGDHALDDSYTSIRAEWCGLEFLVESATDEGRLFLLITPLKFQLKPARLILETGFMWNHFGAVKKNESGLYAQSELAEYQIRTTGEEDYSDTNIPSMTQYLSVLLTGPTAFYAAKKEQDQKYSLEEIQEIVKQKKEILNQKHQKYGEDAWMYQALECAIAWDTIYDSKYNRVISPVSRLWSIGSGGYVLFCWDTYFAGIMASAGCKELAYSNVIEISNEHTKAGFVPNLAYGTGQKSEDRSQPPVGAAMLLELYKKYQDKWIVEQLYPGMLKWNGWFLENRSTGKGTLAWGSDPIPVIYGNRWEWEGVHDTYGGALESGLDNSPMYDDIPFDKEKNILMLEDAGLTGLYIMDCQALMELAQILGKTEDVELLKERKEAAQKGLEGLWDEERGFYYNRRTDTGEISLRISPTNFYALFSDAVPEEHVRRVIEEHYYNEEEFYGEWMLPSSPHNDPAFEDQDYWRGRVWAPLNFLVYLAFKKQGLTKECADLAAKSKYIFQKEWDAHRHVHENYNSITGEGCDAHNSDKFYHWGALLSVIELMEKGMF